MNESRSKIFITGAAGFVGKALVFCLLAKKYSLKALVRGHSDTLPTEVEQIYADLADFSTVSQSFTKSLTDMVSPLQATLMDVNTVIHTAARVHIMDDDSTDPLAAFRQVNVEGTLNLARQAAEKGVRRFIFVSSVKVNGEMTAEDHPFKPDGSFIPTDPYGLSKYEAEQGLLELAKQTRMEVVIVRPPLVYGPGVKANFAAMINLVSKGLPLPFGAIHNQRSLVALDNLVSFIIHCIDHPKAANEIFLISDGVDVSTTVLIKKVAKAFDKKAWLLPIPVSWMTFVAKLVGKTDVTERLFGSLQVDSSKARDLLGWKPVVTMDEQLKKIAENYLSNEKNF